MVGIYSHVKHQSVVVNVPMFYVKDTKLPTIGLPVKEGRDGLWGKTREAFRYVWERYQDEVDWFLKADDDT